MKLQITFRENVRMLSNEAITRGTLANKYFVLVCLVGFAYNFAINAVNISFSLYIDFLGGSPGITGLAAFGSTMLAVAARFVSSYTSDRIGRRVTMIYGCIIYALSVWLCGVVPVIAVAVLMRSVQGFGFAAANTGASAANIDVSPPEKLGLASASFYIVSSVGLIICGFILTPIASAGRFGTLYNIVAALLVAGALFSWLCDYEKTPEYGEWKRAREASERELSEFRGLQKYFEKSALPASIVALVQCMAFGLILIFMLLFGKQMEIPYYGMFFTVGAVFAIACNFLGSGLAQRHKPLPALVPSFLFIAAAMTGLAIAQSTFFYFLTAVAYGICYGLCYPLLYAEALGGVPANRRGAASGTLLIANDLGIGIGGALWGITTAALGFKITFILAAALYALSAVLSIVFFRKSSNN